ncbi:uncharacterized protein V1516DRAFT_677645 [Lipomyces oligophaga]|uniref:uncharacterized protein n=1 Tax=Lipomyces oligophaga TaxID=45792 RepID=UPI0034CD0F40
MARGSSKKQAQANIEALKSLHISAAAINGLYLLSHFLLRRPSSIKPYIIFSLPAWIIEYQLERIGRPKFSSSNGSLISAGEDLTQAGLTEWLFDIVYVTMIIDILAVVFGRSWVWFLYLVIPAYGSYMAYSSFIGPILKQRAAASRVQEEPESEPNSRKKSKKEKVKYIR